MSDLKERAAGRYVQPALAGTLTHENLAAAVAHEALAAAEWQYFGRIAEIEGYPEAARALRELAEQHLFCVYGHLDLLVRAKEPLTHRLMGDTRQNLAVAAQFEQGDGAELPGHARSARNEGFVDIASWFESVAALRTIHAARLQEILTGLDEAARGTAP